MTTQIATYWGNKGKFQNTYDQLRKLIPDSGACTHPRTTNKALDKLRRAGNCYYDLYNNGLWNTPAAEFFRVFGVRKYEVGTTRLIYQPMGRPVHRFETIFTPKLEAALDDIIIAAAIEQGVPCVD